MLGTQFTGEHDIGCLTYRHQAHAENKLSGTLVYQDGALVVSYGRTAIPANCGDKFGVLLICQLPNEFTPTNTKVDFEECGRYPRVRARFGQEFQKYVSDLENASPDMPLKNAEFEALEADEIIVNWMQCAKCAKWSTFLGASWNLRIRIVSSSSAPKTQCREV